MNSPFGQDKKTQESVTGSKEATAPVSSKTEMPTPTVLLSQADAYVHERTKAQPRTLREVDVEIEKKFNPDQHRLSLPRELDPHLKKYVFHWIMKSPRAISEACDLKGWVLVNRTHFPELPGHLFSVTGSIERGDLILGFMKATKAEKYRSDVALKSREMVQSRLGAHEGKPGFYIPKDQSEDDGSAQVIGL